MGSAAEMLLWTWIVLDLGASSASLPEISDRAFIGDCVREHNRARSSVSPPASNMLHMTWDEDLAFTAKAWAKHCVFEHNPNPVHPKFTPVGENIWTGHPPFDVKRAIKRWVDEKLHYNYQANTCSSICGHYTQVVWESSYKVGCAAHLCPQGVAKFDSREAVMFVCNYGKAGNINGKRPYGSQGAACSGCEGVLSCVDSLCRYSLNTDADPALAATGSKFVHILIVRPIALLLTFITAYAVHHFYPNVFCYE